MPAGIPCHWSASVPAMSPLGMTSGRSCVGKPASLRRLLFHSDCSVLKYPQLAAFCTDITGFRRLANIATMKSCTVPAQLNLSSFSELCKRTFSSLSLWSVHKKYGNTSICFKWIEMYQNVPHQTFYNIPNGFCGDKNVSPLFQKGVRGQI